MQNNDNRNRAEMSDKQMLIQQARELLFERGQEGVDLSRKLMLQEKIPYEPLQNAVEYFISSWEDVLHPALLALACEAVGGKAQKTTIMGAAFVLLAGSADLHDDIIDGSVVKDSKPTVYGKFGKDMTVLAGDALLFKGLYVMHEACLGLPESQREAILRLVMNAFLGLSSVEAKETSLRGRIDSADQFFNMIKTKSYVTEATMKIGAILGEGTTKEIEALGEYGKTLSVLSTLRDEFIDVFEADELKNRYKNECLPLPILLTFKDPEKSKKLLTLFSQNEISEKDIDEITDLVIDSKQTKLLKKKMRLMISLENLRLRSIKTNKNSFMLLIDSLMEDL
jgi:geranylgeranyl diphosphate synthase type II